MLILLGTILLSELSEVECYLNLSFVVLIGLAIVSYHNISQFSCSSLKYNLIHTNTNY